MLKFQKTPPTRDLRERACSVENEGKHIPRIGASEQRGLEQECISERNKEETSVTGTAKAQEKEAGTEVRVETQSQIINHQKNSGF